MTSCLPYPVTFSWLSSFLTISEPNRNRLPLFFLQQPLFTMNKDWRWDFVVILVKVSLVSDVLFKIQVCISYIFYFSKNLLWQNWKRDSKWLDLHISLPITLTLLIYCIGHTFSRYCLVVFLWSMSFMFNIFYTLCSCVQLITVIKTLYFPCTSIGPSDFRNIFVVPFSQHLGPVLYFFTNWIVLAFSSFLSH